MKYLIGVQDFQSMNRRIHFFDPLRQPFEKRHVLLMIMLNIVVSIVVIVTVCATGSLWKAMAMLLCLGCAESVIYCYVTRSQ